MIVIATLGLLILLGLTIFQLLLVFGKPLGELAWGGGHKILPIKLRIASGFSIMLYVIFALFLAQKAALIDTFLPQPVINTSMWILVGYFTLGIIMNFISRSKKERAVMTPVALILATAFFVVAR